jgi:hypothetical protein
MLDVCVYGGVNMGVVLEVALDELVDVFQFLVYDDDVYDDDDIP